MKEFKPAHLFIIGGAIIAIYAGVQMNNLLSEMNNSGTPSLHKSMSV